MTPDINTASILTQSLAHSLPIVFRAIWPLWILMIIVTLGKILFYFFKKHKLSKAGMNEIDVMDGKTFEEFLAGLFQKMGYTVKHVGSFAGDYGADLIITKDDRVIAVQAKRHKSVIGVDAIREVLGSIKMCQCNRAMVVTNSYFTKQAKKLARANNIQLWDRILLANQIVRNI